MKAYDSCSPPSKKISSKWMLMFMILLFFLTLTTFSVMEVRSIYNEEPSVVRIIMNSFKSSEESELSEGSKKFVLVNVEQQPHREELIKSIINQEEQKASQPERKAREAVEDKSARESKNSYYEEQSPVVVYSKSEQEAPYAYRQPAQAPPKEDSNEEEPFAQAAESRQSPYDSSEEQGYYGNQGDQQQDQSSEEKQPDSNGHQYPAYFRPGPESQYYDDSRENFSGRQLQQRPESAEGRSAQNSNYDSYYRNWHYATASPNGASANKRIHSENGQENRKLQVAAAQNSDPYAAYLDDYDYMPKRPSAGSYQMQQYHAPSQALDKSDDQNHEMNILSIIKTLKTMWDLYQSFASSWNTMAEKRNKEQELAKQKYKKQMQMRINANKQKQNNAKKNQENTTKKTKTTKPTTTPSTSTTSTESSSDMETSTEEEEQQQEQPQSSKGEPRRAPKGSKGATKQEAENLREKRQADNTDAQSSDSTDVGEGRYIKGDPLKGYYDFVITEGSYKFWAVFQVGTALLIIYSTFAAIYYSKVNPLVSDYDYTDYLGGGRSLTGGDLDFVDDESATAATAADGSHAQQKSWLDWLPRTGHSLKFILDAIDKLPADHDEKTPASNEYMNANNDKEMEA